MKSLQVLVELFLIEGRLEDVKKKFPELDADIDKLAARDPSRQNKYLMWAARQLKSGADFEKLVGSIELFHKNNSRLKIKDINQFKTLEDLDKELQTTQEPSNTQKRKEIKAGADKIYEDDEYFVVNPKTTEAATQYGANTKWCISATKGKNHFNEYSGNNIHFFFIMRKSPIGDNYDKIAYAYKKDTTGEVLGLEIYDAEDKWREENEVSSVLGAKYQAIISAIKSSLGSEKYTLRYQQVIEKATEYKKKFEAGKISAEDFRDTLIDEIGMKEEQASEFVASTIAGLPAEKFKEFVDSKGWFDLSQYEQTHIATSNLSDEHIVALMTTNKQHDYDALYETKLKHILTSDKILEKLRHNKWVLQYVGQLARLKANTEIRGALINSPSSARNIAILITAQQETQYIMALARIAPISYKLIIENLIELDASKKAQTILYEDANIIKESELLNLIETGNNDIIMGIILNGVIFKNEIIKNKLLSLGDDIALVVNKILSKPELYKEAYLRARTLISEYVRLLRYNQF